MPWTNVWMLAPSLLLVTHSCSLVTRLHNHFVVRNAMTGYERSSGRFNSGKVALFGECVLGFLRTSLKGRAQWTHGIWLSETANNDCHIIGTASGIFVTRSIRRLPDTFKLEMGMWLCQSWTQVGA
jgi:hypothetical protein